MYCDKFQIHIYFLRQEREIMNGTITNIQRFSLHDGDGIRTTVFLKGCNMRCAWCHNPETLEEENTPLFYARKCIGCGHCYTACPTGARKLNFQRPPCIGCGKCADVCYPEAIKMASKKMSAEEVMNEIRQDALYYRYSGGGVTFSGGEALCQKDFVAEVAAACRAEGLETAIETNLFHKFDEIRPALEKMTLIMADIKLMDCDAHIKWTGVPNDLILENAKRLGELGIPIIFRTPLIPGVTDTEENLMVTAKFVSQIPNVLYYELLNFNPLGADKYTALRMDNAFRSAKPLPKARLAEIEAALKDCGVQIKIS